MQPLGTEKSRRLLGQKNNATSPDDKKITQPLGKKKKIPQPLDIKNNYAKSREKKKSCNLSGQKYNHLKSRNLLGQKKSGNLLG